MKKHPDGSITDLPVVKPATASPNNYQDSLMQATKMSAEEVQILDCILAHYEKRYV